MIWWIAAGLLAALALLPLGIRFSYRENRGQLRLKIGPVVWTVYPKREKPQQNPPPEQPQEKPEQPKRASSEVPPQHAASPQPGVEKRPLGDYLPLLRLGLDLFGDLRRKIRMDRLELHLLLAGGDPCDLAVNYGRTWAAVGTLLPQLERLFVIRKRDVQVQCDFAGTRSSVTAGVDVTITLGRLLALLAVYGVRGLKEYRTLKGKGGAEHESETSQHAGNNHSENP